MTDLKSQRTIAAKILKSGKNRVWIDPSKINDLEDSITSADVRKMINDGVVRAKPKRGISRFRKKAALAQKKKGRRKGEGSKKGRTSGDAKRRWMKTVRALRKELAGLRKAGKITPHDYRNLYLKSKSGFFRSRKHLLAYIKDNIGIGGKENVA